MVLSSHSITQDFPEGPFPKKKKEYTGKHTWAFVFLLQLIFIFRFLEILVYDRRIIFIILDGKDEKPA